VFVFASQVSPLDAALTLGFITSIVSIWLWGWRSVEHAADRRAEAYGVTPVAAQEAV
jgi:hypothetical protein